MNRKERLNRFNQYSSVQSLSYVQVFVSPWTTARQASLSTNNFQSLLKLMSLESLMLSNSLILCHPLSFCLQSFPASESFLMSQFFASGGQRIGASVSESVLLVNIQGWFSLALTAFRDFSNYQQRDPRWREQSLTRCRPWKPSDSPLITSSLPNAPQTPIFCWTRFLKL